MSIIGQARKARIIDFEFEKLEFRKFVLGKGFPPYYPPLPNLWRASPPRISKIPWHRLWHVAAQAATVWKKVVRGFQWSVSRFWEAPRMCSVDDAFCPPTHEASSLYCSAFNKKKSWFPITGKQLETPLCGRAPLQPDVCRQGWTGHGYIALAGVAVGGALLSRIAHSTAEKST